MSCPTVGTYGAHGYKQARLPGAGGTRLSGASDRMRDIATPAYSLFTIPYSLPCTLISSRYNPLGIFVLPVGVIVSMSFQTTSRIFRLSCIAVVACLQGCFDIDDYIKKVDEPAPEIPKPYQPAEVVDPPDQGGGTKPGGSGGIIPGGGDPVDPYPGPGGGEVKDPEKVSITALTPATGDVRGGYEIRLYGTLLDAGGSLRFGNVPAPKLIPVNAQVVRVTVPPGRMGCVDVSWTQNGETVVSPKGFCYAQDVSVTSASPAVAVQNAVTPVDIQGEGFDESTRIFLSDGTNTLPLVQPRLLSDSHIAGYLPALAPGDVDILAVGTRNHVQLDDAIAIHPELRADGASPSAVQTGTAPQITMQGSGFDADTRLRVGNAAVTPTVISPSQLSFAAPSLGAGTYDILVYNAGQQKRLAHAIRYYTDDGMPQILSAAPSSGSSLGGDSLRITGVNLPTSGTATVGTATADVAARSATSWTVTTPPHAPGAVDIQIGSALLRDGFAYYDGAFDAKSIAPEHGKAGDTVTVRGAGFRDAVRVAVGAWDVASVEVVSDTEIRFALPPGAGTVPVTVSQDGASKTLSFTYDDDFAFTSLSPAQSVITGGTPIHVYGSGFTPQMKIRVGKTEVESTYRHPGLIEFNAPAHEAGTDRVSIVLADGSELAGADMEWFDPTGINTSASGGIIDGQVHVTVLTTGTPVPIPGATIYVGSDLASARTAVTDDNGHASIFDESLHGAQIVMACAKGHSCNMLQPVNASHVTLLLEKWVGTGSETETDPPPPPPPPPEPPESGTINPIEVVVPYTPKQPYLVGTVGGFGKYELQTDPNLVQAGFVMQSALADYTLSHDKNDVYILFQPGDTYRIKARKGDVALTLLCGLYNKQTKAFFPKYIGVKRHLFVNDGDVLTNHLECPLPLSETQAVKLLDAPLHSGPNMVSGSAYIFLGAEGYIGGFMSGYSETDYVVITKLPPFRDELADAKLALTVGAYTDYGYPASVFSESNITPSEEPIELGPAAPIPKILTQQGDILKSGQILWSVEYPQNVDFYALTVYMRNYEVGANNRLFLESSNLLAQLYLPGTATHAEFPTNFEWPDSGNGQLQIRLVAYKSIRDGFDFNLFSTGELRFTYIHSSAESSITVLQPKPQTSQETP